MTRILGVIPARMGSSRFPGKPLALLHGRPMVEHVFRATRGCALLDEVVVATPDDDIARAVERFGARAVLTSPTHERATDRVAEVSADDAAGIVVMVQGDEPVVRPEMVSAAVNAMLAGPEVLCVNLGAPIRSPEELLDPNTIKVVMDRGGRALYFSRSPIPALGQRRFSTDCWWKQVCVIAFRREALLAFAAMPQGPLEVAESVDMLRFLENGVSVHVVPTRVITHAVDTESDLALVASLMADWPPGSSGE